MSRHEIDGMIETLDAVFQEGRVFEKVLASPPPPPRNGTRPQRPDPNEEPLPQISADGGKCGFIATAVMRNLRKEYVFFAGGMPVLLWKTPPEEVLEEMRKRLQNVAALTKDRLRADFPRGDVRSALAVFDRRAVKKGFGDLPSLETRKRLLRGVGQLAQLLGREQVAATLQYAGVLACMLVGMASPTPFQRGPMRYGRAEKRFELAPVSKHASK